MRNKGNCRLVLSIDLIMRSIVVDIDAEDIRPIEPKPTWRGSNTADLRSLHAKDELV